MGNLSRREKKVAIKMLKSKERIKQQEGSMIQDPHQSYKRKTVYTRMPWPLELILMGRSDVLALIVVGILIVVVVVGLVLYFGINWAIKTFGWLWPW